MTKLVSRNFSDNKPPITVPYLHIEPKKVRIIWSLPRVECTKTMNYEFAHSNAIIAFPASFYYYIFYYSRKFKNQENSKSRFQLFSIMSLNIIQIKDRIMLIISLLENCHSTYAMAKASDEIIKPLRKSAQACAVHEFVSKCMHACMWLSAWERERERVTL